MATLLLLLPREPLAWNTLNQMGHAPQPPGGKQSGVRKVNSESDLKVKERARVPHFSRGEGTRGYVQTRGAREAKVALPESGVLEGRF